MHSSPAYSVSITVGDFVFFSVPGTSNVEAGRVTAVDSYGILSVHEHRQAPKITSRFVPLYYNSRTHRHELREVAHEYHTPDMSYVKPADVIISGVIDKYTVASSMLAALKSHGVSDE